MPFSSSPSSSSVYYCYYRLAFPCFVSSGFVHHIFRSVLHLFHNDVLPLYLFLPFRVIMPRTREPIKPFSTPLHYPSLHSLHTGYSHYPVVFAYMYSASLAFDRAIVMPDINSRYLKVKLYAIFSDTHQLQFMKRQHLKLEIFKSI